jgi:transposase
VDDLICDLGRDGSGDAARVQTAVEGAFDRIAELETENAKLLERIGILEEENRDLQAKVAGLNQLHFGKSTEKKKPAPRGSSSKPPADDSTGKRKRKRGQQPGSEGHGRRNYDDLPTTEEVIDLPEEDRVCECCGLPFEPFPGTDDSEFVEIEVKAHRRKIRRKRYRKGCSCSGGPTIVTAPPPPAVIPKSRIGVSVWVTVLLDKFLYLRPTYRLLKDLESHGLSLSQGTLTGGLRSLSSLFDPIYNAFHAKCLQADHWHADETRWPVFVPIEGKKGTRWYLWVFKSPEVVYYVLDPTRSAEVPKEFFGKKARGIVSADRYSAYKSLMKLGRLLIAFCWVHMRRDVLRLGQRYKEEHAEWSAEWIERIAKLYDLNDKRLLALADEDAFFAAHAELHLFLLAMEEVRDAELATDPREEKAKVLRSMVNHWDGLTLFVNFPDVPLDNSEAERRIRSPAVGRKNYYGSGSVWSGRLAAMMFSILQTLELQGLCPRKWMTRYLTACAEQRGKVPEDLERFLPWNLKEEDRALLLPGTPRDTA